MLKKFTVLAVVLSISAMFIETAFTSSGGPPTGHSGAPGSGNCTACHGDFAVNSGPATRNLVFNGDPTLSAYVPGQTYTAVLNINSAGISTFGFQLVARNSANQSAGTLIATDAVQTQLVSGHLQQTFSGITGSSGAKSWNFSWTAPAAGTGTVSFYVATNAANGDGGSSGDRIYTNVFTLTEAAAPATVGSASVVQTAVCRGGSLTVNFTSTGTFASGNVFTVELSDELGGFTTPVNIGSITGTTATSITANTPLTAAAGAGYRVRVVASNPASTGSQSGNFAITIPATTPSLSFDGRVLSTTGTGNFVWFRDGNTISGATGNSFIPAQAGNYVVGIENNGCSPSLSTGINVTFGYSNFDSLAFTDICESTPVIISYQTFGTPSAGNTTSAELLSSTDSVIPVNMATPVVVILPPGLVGNGFRIRLRSTNPVSYSPLSTPFNIIGRPVPPTIIDSGFSLTASGLAAGATISWYLDGNVIAGQSNQTLQVTQNGIYHASATLNNCVSELSNSISFTNVSVHENLATEFLIYPNPVTDVLQLQLPQVGRLSCYDMQGRLIRQQQLESGPQTWGVEQYAPGLYLMVYESAGKLHRQRFVKR
ncbi:MAG: choice-of-anchor V domain-containing protein [Bacteroidia bacterium]